MIRVRRQLGLIGNCGVAQPFQRFAIFQQQLAARWKFDDTTSGSGGTAADSSGNGNTGAVGSGANWSTTGKLADALSFSSGAGFANSLVTVPSSATLNPRAQISVTTWVNAIDWTGNHRIIQKGVTDNQYRLLVENGKLKFDLFIFDQELIYIPISHLVRAFPPKISIIY